MKKATPFGPVGRLLVQAFMVVLLVVSGAQLLVMGVIGEYLWRSLDETRRRPRYVLEARVDGGADDRP